MGSKTSTHSKRLSSSSKDHEKMRCLGHCQGKSENLSPAKTRGKNQNFLIACDQKMIMIIIYRVQSSMIEFNSSVSHTPKMTFDQPLYCFLVIVHCFSLIIHEQILLFVSSATRSEHESLLYSSFSNSQSLFSY